MKTNVTCFVKMLRFEQRVDVKFCPKLRKTTAEVLERLSSIYIKTAVYDSFELFENGQKSLIIKERNIVKTKQSKNFNILHYQIAAFGRVQYVANTIQASV